jgi:Haem-NO-binding
VKGIVFNLLQEVVTAAHGADAWDDLLDRSNSGGVYTSLGSYPDEELERLVETACDMLGLSRDAVLRWFGAEAMPLLAKAYPAFFANHTSARTFVAGINNVIHAEVRKLYTGAECPHFNIREPTEGVLTMDYRSSRRMCALAQGFVEGAGKLYGEALEFHHVACTASGADRCVFEVRWPAQMVSAA